ncbi:MAG: VCBS repeat-containing protein, partial [Bacteroidales bacterium]
MNRVIETDSVHVLNFEYIYNGAGVGVMDLNNDGLQDLIFTANQVSPRIYLNEGDFKFRDISARFLDLDNGQWYSGVTFLDINNDGWKDPYFTCTAYEDLKRNKNRLFVSQDTGKDELPTYTDQAESYGIADESFTVHAAFFDYDLDGDLDLYLMNNFVNDRLSASYRAKINNGTADNNDDLYRNDGDGNFTNVTLEAGIVYEGFGLGLSLGDVNKDGYPDLYISNDFISNDLLYINQKDGTFRNEISHYMSYQTKSSMGNDMADINNDGNQDMFTLDMLPEQINKRKQTINGFGYIYFTNDARYGYEHQFLRNMLHMHNGFANGEMIPFSEVGQMLGIYATEWSWSPLFADYDNDGDKDMIVANGYPVDMTDKDWTRYKVEVYGNVADARHVINKAPSQKVPNVAYENVGNLKFVKKQDGEWFHWIPSYSYGASFVDLDNDGDLDYVTNNLNDEAFIYRNRTVEDHPGEAHYLRIRLNGKEANPYAFGAKIDLWCNGIHQYQELFLSRGYISSVDPVVHFGLGEFSIIDSVRITWPSTQRVTVLKKIDADQLLEISETDSHPGPSRLRESGTGSFFHRAPGVLSYLHREQDFIDYNYKQNVIPHKFSQMGPRMQKGDLNGDGLDDILIGATNQLPTAVYIRDGDKFTETTIEGLSGPRPFSEADMAIIDVDDDGDQDVIALAGGYEYPDDQYLHYLYRNNAGTYEQEQLPIGSFPASVVRPFDMDHDGDLDLFIGARVARGMFPFSDDSWILFNHEGAFSEESSVKFNLGMVTDAVWSDYDGDGWEDLLITREWNSIAILKNIEGTRITSQELPEIKEKHGIWTAIEAADFDLDGDEDYLLGNLGENNRFTISDRYPLRIYALDMDLNGTLDPISTGYWPNEYGKMTEYPINYLDELAGQSSYFRRKYPNFTLFSYTSIDEILDSTLMKRVDYIFHVNTASSYILWNENGTFRWEPLPRRAQVAPIKKMVVRDFNGDGLPDVLLGGNDHTYDISTGYYDANKGIIMASKDGKPL